MKASTHRGQGGKTRFLAVDRVNTANGAVKKKRSWMLGTRKEIKLWMKPAPGADPAHLAHFPKMASQCVSATARSQRKICQWFSKILQDDRMMFCPFCGGRGGPEAGTSSWETYHLKLELQRQKT